VDFAGNVIVAGQTDEGLTGKDILVIKYSGAGIPLWTHRYDGPANGDDQPSAVAVDRSGNVLAGRHSAPSALRIQTHRLRR
jgi:hypothetical protein